MNNLFHLCKSFICKSDVNNLKYEYSQTWPNDHLPTKTTILKAQLQFV